MPGTDKLIEGYRRFKQGYSKDKQHLLQELAGGQSPKVALVSCCDSRVEPSIIMDCEPGDLFVVRNVANLVPPFDAGEQYHGASAALEFAVTGLQVESIVVLGHTQCGGIKALMDSEEPPQDKSFITSWMRQLLGVKQDILKNHAHLTQEQKYHACERNGVRNSIENLMTFPWVKERVEAGSLELHGWYYDLNGADLYAYNEKAMDYEKIS